MADLDVTIEVEIKCSRCGGDLNATGDNHARIPRFTVEPCEVCEEKVKDKAADEAYDRGLTDGVRDAQLGEEAHE
jgi:hypothetical protein